MRVIEKEITVSGSPVDVWTAWTTNDGVRSFFAPDSVVELAVGGKYEIYFNSTMPYGGKGSEGCKVLTFAPGKNFSFSWNAPPAIPLLRASGEYTRVDLEFKPVGAGTNVSLRHTIEKEGEDWVKYYDYFMRAWDVVLGRLQLYFVSGPIDWNS